MGMRTKKSRFLALGVLLAAGLAAAAPQKPHQPYALVVGTGFFEDSGRLVRGAKVEVKQKEGRKRMRQFGKVDIPQSAFIAALKMGDE